MGYTMNFIDLFDWEKENDMHYYFLLTGRDLRLEERTPATIEIVHDVTQEEYENYDQIDEGTLSGTDEEGVHP